MLVIGKKKKKEKASIQFNLKKTVPLASDLRKLRGNFHGTKQSPSFLNSFSCVCLPNLTQQKLSQIFTNEKNSIHIVNQLALYLMV